MGGRSEGDSWRGYNWAELLEAVVKYPSPIHTSRYKKQRVVTPHPLFFALHIFTPHPLFFAIFDLLEVTKNSGWGRKLGVYLLRAKY